MLPRNAMPIKNLPKKKSRPSLLGRPFLWFFGIALVFVGFGILARLPGMQTKVFEYNNIVVTDTEDVTQSLEIYFEKRFLYPKSNRLWFSERKAEDYIEQQFPRIARVKINSSSGSFSVYGEEREGKYLWCGNNPVEVSIDLTCYFADDTGFIFDTAPYFSGISYLRLYGGNVSEVIIGSQAFPQEVFDLYESFQKTLLPFDLEIQGVYLSNKEQIEFILASNNTLPEAPRLKHYGPNNKDIVLENIQAALRQESVLLDITSNYDRLEYLDARFKNQIVYKFRDIQSIEEPIYEESISQNDSNIQEETQDSSDTER